MSKQRQGAKAIYIQQSARSSLFIGGKRRNLSNLVFDTEIAVYPVGNVRTLSVSASQFHNKDFG